MHFSGVAAAGDEHEGIADDVVIVHPITAPDLDVILPALVCGDVIMIRNTHLAGAILSADDLGQVPVDGLGIRFRFLNGFRGFRFGGLGRRILLLSARTAGNGGKNHRHGHQAHFEVSHIIER